MPDYAPRLEPAGRNSSGCLLAANCRTKKGKNVKPKTALKSKKVAREGFQMLPQPEDLTKNMAVVGGSLSPGGVGICVSFTGLLPT